jgi:hypothetical protein
MFNNSTSSLPELVKQVIDSEEGYTNLAGTLAEYCGSQQNNIKS